MAVLLAVLVLGIGYAAILDVELDLNGTANINANFDFSVVYDEDHTIQYSTVTGDDASVLGEYVSEDEATMTVTLDKDNRSLYAIYKVINTSPELSATLEANVDQQITVDADDNDVTAYFNNVTAVFYTTEACTTELEDNKIAKNGAAYLKVTVSLDELPIEDVVGAEFLVKITAHPAEVN